MCFRVILSDYCRKLWTSSPCRGWHLPGLFRKWSCCESLCAVLLHRSTLTRWTMWFLAEKWWKSSLVIFILGKHYHILYLMSSLKQPFDTAIFPSLIAGYDLPIEACPWDVSTLPPSVGCKPHDIPKIFPCLLLKAHIVPCIPHYISMIFHVLTMAQMEFYLGFACASQ